MRAHGSKNGLVAAIAVNVLVVVLEVWAIWFGVQKNGVAGNFVFYTECSNLLGGIVCAMCAVAEVRLLLGGIGGPDVRQLPEADGLNGPGGLGEPGNSSRLDGPGSLGGPGGLGEPGKSSKLNGPGGLGEPGKSSKLDGPGSFDVPELARWLRWAKYAASCCLLMTLFVVTIILAPMLNSIGEPGYYLMFVDGAKSVTHLGAPLLVTGSYIAFEADRDMTLRQSLVGFAPTLAYAVVAYPCNIALVWDGPYPFFQVWNMPVWQSILWFAALFALGFSLCQIPRLASRRKRTR